MDTNQESLACPSSRADSPQSAVFGIVDNRGDFPIIRYLERPIAATPEVLALAKDEHPNQVFRFTSPCQGSRCGHFVEGQCDLPRFLQNHLPAAQTKHVSCPIRGVCRWFHQESFSACSRCAVVVTAEYTVVDGQLINPHEVAELPKGPAVQQQNQSS